MQHYIGALGNVAWLAEVSTIRLLGIGAWVVLLLLLVRSGGGNTSPTRSRPIPPWWKICVVVLLCARGVWSLWVEAADADEWLYLGYAKWIGNNWDALPTLFTELVNPTEPIIRLLPLIWMGLDTLWLGAEMAPWALVTLLGHLAVAYGVYHVGLRLRLQPYGAALAGLIFLAHPVATEGLLWPSVGREVVMMNGFLLLALCAHLDRKWLSAMLCFAAALLSREHALGFLALAPLCDWRAGRRFSPRLYLAYSVLVVLPMFAWRTWLFEASNAAQVDYLTELLRVGSGTVLMHGAVDMLGWFFIPVTGTVLFAHLWVLVAVCIGATSMWKLGEGAHRHAVIRWVVFSAVFAGALVGPSLLDLEPPGSDWDGTRLPNWNVRHMYGPVIGISLTLGAGLQAVRTRWAIFVLALLLLSTSVLSGQYLAPSLRVAAARDAQASLKSAPNMAVRFVQPQDAAAVFFLNRRILEPDAVGLPVLVGEPRCGCAAMPIDYDVASLPRLRDVWHAVNTPLVFEPSKAGDTCRCEPWRSDAIYLRFDESSARLE